MSEEIAEKEMLSIFFKCGCKTEKEACLEKDIDELMQMECTEHNKKVVKICVEKNLEDFYEPYKKKT